MITEKNISKEDVLSQARTLLLKPSKNTKRKILIAVNLIVIFLAILHITLQLTKFGKLPDPARDMVFYPLILLINLFSALYNLRIILKEKEGTKFWNGFTTWSSIVILMIMSLATVHTNPNTATSLLFDTAFSVILIFVVGTVLNRRVSVIWFVISSISLYFAYTNRGTDFTYYLMTKQQVQTIEQQLEQNNPEAIEWLQQAKEEKIEPLPIGLFVRIWFMLLLLAFLTTFFESGMIGKVLKAIPTVISNINIAAEQKNKLENENLRMGMELDVAKRIQTMVLPQKSEFANCKDLEIAALMDTASEVGGDFYDILPQKDGSTIFGIGDVTDHGLQSGIVMLMTQSAMRTAIDNTGISLSSALTQINNLIYSNVQTRLKDKRNLTLSLLKYDNNKITIAGQHEFVILLKKDKQKADKIETLDLGIYVGLIENIDQYISEKTLDFEKGDSILLYTDGVTEAENKQGQFYGLHRLMATLEKNRHNTAEEIIENISKDVYTFIEGSAILDDISLIIIKRV
jgi:sigma-B regulation protein RsbU (phosphoserine phosphatase)